VPLLYQETNNLNLLVSLVVDTTKKAVEKFGRTAELLRIKYTGNLGLERYLKVHIEASQFSSTGNLFWPLRTSRYGVNAQMMTGAVPVSL
jgi:hypothetical protein